MKIGTILSLCSEQKRHNHGREEMGKGYAIRSLNAFFECRYVFCFFFWSSSEKFNED